MLVDIFLLLLYKSFKLTAKLLENLIMLSNAFVSHCGFDVMQCRVVIWESRCSSRGDNDRKLDRDRCSVCLKETKLKFKVGVGVY